MRRATSIVALSLMLIVIVGTAVSAKGQGGAAAVTFSAEGGTGPAGGALSVSAAVHGATPGTTFSAVALVHFATGAVSVTFGPSDTAAISRITKSHERHRRHHPHWWRRHHGHDHHRPGPKPDPQPGVDLTATTQVPISGEEAWGRVDIDVTITYGDKVATVSTFGVVDGYSD